ncbi:hypothetical protein ASO20_00710 [Mycoplasma sp. (ex Biomphalaria glabrata)]|uniref:thiamine diphosphokinase n=1 Tax=Mycoplasma sp. (ex Biomphalaria glabrata) TaxID=1749074 RepID=UPI00073AC28D|nr:thiamine diphosphokinase [Mycoplasma sp. (ex Biomphalaria glabrata)]ALV23197.1 hypothetical protein ASO20_00710 [Mycoplasma sp. (ex Biomphalaria glabrata)]
MKECVILATSEINDYLKKIIHCGAPIIATERGVLYAIQNNLNLVYSIGDFDSLTTLEWNFVNSSLSNVKKLNWDKDKTDLEECFEYALNEGFNKFHIITKNGNRWDHCINNLNFLKKNKELNITLYSANNRVYVIKKGKNQIYPTFHYISLFPFSDDLITTDGLYWNWVDKKVTNSDASISNQLENKKMNAFSIHSKSGSILVIETID